MTSFFEVKLLKCPFEEKNQFKNYPKSDVFLAKKKKKEKRRKRRRRLVSQRLNDSAPSSCQMMKFLTAVTVGATLLILSRLPLLHNRPFVSPAEALLWDYQHLLGLYNHEDPKTKSPIVSCAPSGSSQYFVSLCLGTLPQTLLLVTDTGNDLVWVKCIACKTDCFAATHVPGFAFLARHSSTFSPHHCFDSPCRLVPHPPHSHYNHTSWLRLHIPCRYQYSYADGSLTSGFFSKETTMLNTSNGREAGWQRGLGRHPVGHAEKN
jgi:hypothetical protein